MNWVYNGCIVDSIPDGYIGFVYKLTYEIGNDEYVYYGQKIALTVKKKHFTKKQREAITDKRLKTYTLVPVELDWKRYKGSCKSELLDKAILIEKEILQFCKTRKHLTYLEAKIIFKNDGLEDKKCLNGNILSKFFVGDLDGLS